MNDLQTVGMDWALTAPQTAEARIPTIASPMSDLCPCPSCHVRERRIEVVPNTIRPPWPVRC